MQYSRAQCTQGPGAEPAKLLTCRVMLVSNSFPAWLISPFAKSAMTWLMSLMTCGRSGGASERGNHLSLDPSTQLMQKSCQLTDD